MKILIRFKMERKGRGLRHFVDLVLWPLRCRRYVIAMTAILAANPDYLVEIYITSA